MFRLILVLFCLSITACGSNTSDSNHTADYQSKPLEIKFERTKLQTDRVYKIEITRDKVFDSASDVQLSLILNDITKQDDYLLDFDVDLTENKADVSFSIKRLGNSLEWNILAKIELDINGEELEQREVAVWGFPKVSELNMPQKNVLVNDKTINALPDNGGVYFYWLNLPPWTPPENPTWEEDPFGNISWRLFYHAMSWLTSYVELYERTGDEKYRKAIDRYLTDYDETFKDPFNTHIPLAYREDASSVRVNHLLYVYIKLYKDLPKPEREVIERLIDKDVQALLVYLNEAYWDNKNHGLIQARSALNLVATFPFHKDIEELESSASQRITRLSNALFSNEGFVVEQSSGYHYIGLAMMLEAKLQLDAFPMPKNVELMNTIEKALSIAPYLLYEDGTMPAIGDSSFGNKVNKKLKRYYSEYGEEIPLLESFFSEGHFGLENLKVIYDEGLVIAKVMQENMALSKTFLDVGKSRLIHGHHDQLNFVASLNGEKFLVDSGGPYTYSKAGGRDFWRYRSAQNMLVVNGEETADYNAELISATEYNELIYSSGRANVSKNLSQTRSFLITKEKYPLIIVLDKIDETSSQNLVEEYWHYAPETKVEVGGESNVQLTLKSGKVLQHFQWSNSNADCVVLNGETNVNGVPTIGWVTPRYNQAERAPVLKCTQQSNGYRKINVFYESDEEQLIEVIEGIGFIEVLIGEKSFKFNKNTNQLLR